jgi:hypothetical protein
MWDGSSIGISMVSKPQRLYFGKSFVLLLVKGEVKRKVLIPNLIVRSKVRGSSEGVKTFP